MSGVALPTGLARARMGAEVDRLLRTPLHAAVARHVGAATLRGDLLACLHAVDNVVRTSPEVIPPHLTGVLAGGKRLRPLLVLAVAGPGDPPAGVRARAVAGGAAVELLHVASLVHDDVMDEAPVRHGAETLNAAAGAGTALLAGDLLLGQAHVVAAVGVGAAAATLVGRTLVRLCEGQAEETATRYDARRTEQSYFRSIAGKTGSLIEASCRMGAIAARRDAATTAALGRFGMHLGIAYQLVDDLLDLSPGAGAGKPVGQDIPNGVYTYPTLWALRRDPVLRRLLSGPAADRAGAAAEAAVRVRDAGAADATARAVDRQRVRCLDALGAGAAAIGRPGAELLADVVSGLLDVDPAPVGVPAPVPRLQAV